MTSAAHEAPVVTRAAVRERPAAIRRRRRRRLARYGWNLVGLAIAAVVVFPVFWMVSTAFKPEADVNSLTPTWIPTSPTLDHFRHAIDDVMHPGFWDGVKNSLIVVALTVVLAMVLAFLAAVALAKYHFTGRKIFVALVIGILMLPQVGLIIPLYVVLARYGLTDQQSPLPTGALAGLILTYMTFLLPFAVWTLRGFILGVPKELEEAAMVDGSSRLGAFVRILLPLVAPGPRGDVRLRLHHRLERVRLRERAPERPVEPDAHHLARELPRDEQEHGLGGADGRLDAHGDPGCGLLPPRAAQDRLRSDRGLGQGVSSELEQLAATCLFPGFPGHEPPDWIRRWLGRGLGGVVLYAWNVEDREQLAGLTAALRAERGDVLVAIDEEGGDVTRLEAESGSSYPGNAALGAVDDVELTEQVAAAIGADLAAVGVDLDYAPVADVNTNPLNPIIGIRSFGSEPAHVARHVGAFVRGLQSSGVAACAKHFPGHGDTEADSHLELPVVNDELDAFVAKALPPFRAAIDAGAVSIMTAHILVPAIDDRPATTSRVILGDLLRCELGFEGMLMTDALEMRAISAVMGIEEGAVRALRAGADALCLGHDLAEEALVALEGAIATAVRERRLSEARLVEAASRVRAVARWVAEQPAHADVESDIGLAAARRALRVEGEPALERTPLVVDLEPRPSIAAGSSPGPGEWLRRALPEADVVRLTEDDGRSIPALDGRQLVVVMRDAHRHPWQQAAVTTFLADEDDAIVLEVGLPHWRPTGVHGYLATYGGARVNLEAAAERMAEMPIAGLYSTTRRGVEQSGSSPGS